MQKLDNQVAIVTGASSGIGRGVAIQLAKEGAKVVINYNSSREGALETLKQVKEAGGTGLIVKADVSKEKQVLQLFAKTVEKYGRLDILVNNTGLQVDAAFVDMEMKAWQKVIDVNLTGQFLCAREAARQFLKQEKRGEGSIGKMVFMSSVHDMIPWAGHVNYASSKGGVLMLMKSIAQELAPQQIRVNAVSPGAIQTPINKSVWSSDAKMDELMKLVPYRRIGQPQDVGKAVAWLVSDDADYVIGETLYIDGGMMLYPEFSDNG